MKKILEIKDLSKNFDSIKALKNVNLELYEGEIHGLIGANGSGKSTLMNILFGSKHIRDSGSYEGSIYIEGQRVKINTNRDSKFHGIGMVHQELSLLNELDISNNIKINRENTIAKTDILGEFSIVDRGANSSDAKMALSKVGVEVDPFLKVKNLPTNIKQFIEIAREIDKEGLKILMLDEPTSSLNLEQTEMLLSHLKEIAKTGTSIIFTSHRLEEIMEICDRITVLRDGCVISRYEKDEYEIKKIALDMIGQEVVQALAEKRVNSDENILSFKNTTISIGNKKYSDISLDIKKGEILGITGLAGHGQEMFGYGIMGIYDMLGDIEYKGEKLKLSNSKTAIKNGIYLLPDERKEMGLLMNDSIWENIVFESYGRRKDFLKYPKLNLLSTLNHKVIDSYTEEISNTLNIKIRDIDQLVKELSGGNQQKICVARAITVDPELLFVGDPTRGIDIYSKEIILEMLLKLNQENNTTVVISSGEISELKRVCDRIVIMYENRVFKIFDGDFDSEEFALAISGREGK